MLALADRSFYGFKLWRIACTNGARLAWRVESNLKLPVRQRLFDDSHLGTVFDSADRARQAGQTVRVIDYTLQDSATPVQDSYWLVTNILDPQAAPALGLAAGVLLVLLGVAMLAGRSISVRLPRLPGRATEALPPTARMLTFGVGYALASLACTVGVLLAVIAQAQATASPAGLLLVFGVYAAGSATVLLLLALAT